MRAVSEAMNEFCADPATGAGNRHPLLLCHGAAELVRGDVVGMSVRCARRTENGDLRNSSITVEDAVGVPHLLERAGDELDLSGVVAVRKKFQGRLNDLRHQPTVKRIRLAAC